MENITELKRGSLNGLRRQTNECLVSAYYKGYADGKNEPNEEQEEYIRNLINKAKQEGYDTGYNEGLENAWELIKEIEHNREFEEIVFGKLLINDFTNVSVHFAMEKFKTYKGNKQAEEESIKVGDVVKFNENCHNYDHVKSREYLVLHIFDNGLATLLYDNGDTGAVDISLVDKTGRHIDVTEQLLDKLKGDN